MSSTETSSSPIVLFDQPLPAKYWDDIDFPKHAKFCLTEDYEDLRAGTVVYISQDGDKDTRQQISLVLKEEVHCVCTEPNRIGKVWYIPVSIIKTMLT
jgi:hypothetical protein